MAEAAISFDQLDLGYDALRAVSGLSTQVSKGSLTAVVGPNGAGKSTLIKAVAGLISPLQGSLNISAKNSQDIAYLPQMSEIDRTFPITVRELVAMGMWRKVGPLGRFNRSRRQELAEAISAVGLTGLEDRMIGTLSGGQMQRALFARLLLQDASLVLLDEPFNAVDEKTVKDLIGLVSRWHQEGRTVLAVLHDYETVQAHFPNALMLARELVAHGPTPAVLTAENTFKARQMCEACADFPTVAARRLRYVGPVCCPLC